MESCQVKLHGNSEFEASNVLIEGDQRFVVPDGHRMLVTTGPAGGLPSSCCAVWGLPMMTVTVCLYVQLGCLTVAVPA